VKRAIWRGYSSKILLKSSLIIIVMQVHCSSLPLIINWLRNERLWRDYCNNRAKITYGPQYEAHKRTLVSELTHKCDYIEKLYSEYMSGLEHGSSTETLDVSPTGYAEPVQICVECYCNNVSEQCTCEPLRISLKRRSCVQVKWSLTDQEESEELQKD
jgi:hypothetical protein